MKIFLFDDGVGIFATLCKLKYSVAADYIAYILDEQFPLGEKSPSQLSAIAADCCKKAFSLGAEGVVLSSAALSCCSRGGENVFRCDPPVLHASAYTASKVLVCGETAAVNAAGRFAGVIPLPMPRFPLLAEQGASRNDIAKYVSQCAEPLCGAFDCIALAGSSLSLYKSCFCSVFPNLHVFDSLDGVTRRIRKKYKKCANDESTVQLVSQSGADVSQKYRFFMEELLNAY